MEAKKLYRIPSEGMLGGVCAGFEEHLNVDPTIVRLIFVLLAFAGMSGIPIYLIMWLIIPARPAEVQTTAGAVFGQR